MDVYSCGNCTHGNPYMPTRTLLKGVAATTPSLTPPPHRSGGAPDRYTGVVRRQQVDRGEGRLLSTLPWGRLVVYCTQRGGIHAVDPRSPALTVWSMHHPASEVCCLCGCFCVFCVCVFAWLFACVCLCGLCGGLYGGLCGCLCGCGVAVTSSDQSKSNGRVVIGVDVWVDVWVDVLSCGLGWCMAYCRVLPLARHGEENVYTQQ